MGDSEGQGLRRSQGDPITATWDMSSNQRLPGTHLELNQVGFIDLSQ
jgi:hypothetical protein